MSAPPRERPPGPAANTLARHLVGNYWRPFALLLALAVAVANAIHTARRVPPPAIGVPVSAHDPIAAQEERFQRLRDAAARLGVRGVVGYFGATPAADDDYYYAQFALLPLVLDLNATPHAWAVANLRPDSIPARVPPGWRVAADTGAGVLLLRQETP